MNLEKRLSDRWNDLCERLGAMGKYILVFEMLLDSYSEPYRAYHNLDHISHCLQEFDSVCNLLGHPDEVEMAIWFHDAIKGDEEKSAQFAYRVLKQVGLPDSFANRVYNLILLTKHKIIPKDIDAQILVDVDLAIFGKLDKEFKAYERCIRKEYALPEEQFRINRVYILQRFLDKKFIYCTGFFRKKYEDQARRNLKKSIEFLEKL